MGNNMEAVCFFEDFRNKQHIFTHAEVCAEAIFANNTAAIEFAPTFVIVIGSGKLPDLFMRSEENILAVNLITAAPVSRNLDNIEVFIKKLLSDGVWFQPIICIHEGDILSYGLF